MGTGAMIGSHYDSPLQAALAGVVMHGIMDIAPHGEIHDRQFEIATTAAGLAALGAGVGFRSPVWWGALGGVLPDAEHVLPRRLRGGRGGWFPTHYFKALHSSDAPLSLPPAWQAILGGGILGAFIFGRKRR